MFAPIESLPSSSGGATPAAGLRTAVLALVLVGVGWYYFGFVGAVLTGSIVPVRTLLADASAPSIGGEGVRRERCRDD